MILGLWIISITGILLVFAVLLSMLVVLFLPANTCTNNTTDPGSVLTICLTGFTGFSGATALCVTGRKSVV